MADGEPRRARTRITLGDEPQFDLGRVRVFPSELAVDIDGQRHELQPRIMRVLVALAKARPDVVSRDRLIEQCWDGRIVGDDAINRCVLALRHLADEAEPPPFSIETVPRVGHRLVLHGENVAAPAPGQKIRSWWTVGASATVLTGLMAALLSGGAAHWFSHSDAREPKVLIVPSRREAASAALAQELAVKLGSFAQARPAAMKLIDRTQGAQEHADLILEVGRTDDAANSQANVLLVDPAGTILWTKEFEPSSVDTADFNQQIAFSAARVLGCAVEAIGSSNRPREQDLKTYLEACAAVAASGVDVEKMVPVLRGIVSRSPQFSGGWTKLLQAELLVADETDDPEGEAVRSGLPSDIAAARRHYPDLTEAYLAEYKLKPQTDFVGRSRILDTAVARDPGDAEARIERAMFLLSVGRINDAVGEAHEAVNLDPLSPIACDTYMVALALANRMDAARAQLAEAERLWPGTSDVLMSRYLLDLRFGDPREALRLLRSGAVETSGAQIQEAFLQARIHPSPENVEQAVRVGRNAVRLYPGAIDGQLQTLAQFGRREELLSLLLNWRRMDLVDLITGVIFRPAFSDLRRDPRFMKVAERLGLLTYWRTTGAWPDFCLAPDLPYDCKAVAQSI